MGRAKYVPVYESFWRTANDAQAGLQPLERLEFYEAMFEKVFDGKDHEFDSAGARMLYMMAMPNVEKSAVGQSSGASGGRGKRGSKTQAKRGDETPSETTDETVTETTYPSAGGQLGSNVHGAFKPPSKPVSQRKGEGDREEMDKVISDNNLIQSPYKNTMPFCPLCGSQVYVSEHSSISECPNCGGIKTDRLVWKEES